MDSPNFKDKKYIVLLALLLVSVFLYWFTMSDKNNGVLLKFSARRSANNSWSWLLNYKGDFTSPTVPMVIKIINDKYCHSPVIEVFVKQRWAKFSNHPYYPVFERFFGDWGNYKITDTVKKILSTPQITYNEVLPEAMYCDQLPVNSTFENRAFLNLGNETGYNLTHQFWSAVLFKENGCVTKNYNIDELIKNAANKMVEEQEKSAKVDDLYVERTAFLLNFGFKELVKKEWIENIIKAQDKSGAWITANIFDNNYKDPHTAILGVWALSEYANYCPFGSY